MKDPEPIGVVLPRAIARIRVRPMPCSPKPKKGGGREDSHAFEDQGDGWLRCRLCGWYARSDR